MIKKSYLIALILMFVFVACNKKENKPKPAVKKTQVVKPIKKEVKVNPKEKLAKMKIDRTKTPLAGVWEPSAKDSGFLLLFPDGKFELYGIYDRNCKRAPKKKGTYKVIGERTIEFNMNGKKETVRIKVISGFAEIKGFGIYLLPQGVELQEENKEFEDPKKLIEFCRNVNPESISKIYPYLTYKSKLALIKVGILDQDYLAAHENFTSSIKEFLKPYKKIISIKSVKKDGNKEVFNLKLKDMEGTMYSENMNVVKENGKLRCGFFDELKLVSNRKDTDKITFWYKEMANSVKTHKFFFKKDAKDIVKLRFNGDVIDLNEFKKGNDVPVYSLKGKFKIVSNTPNVVALEVTKKDKTKEIVVFKFGEDEKINLIFKEKVYLKMD